MSYDHYSQYDMPSLKERSANLLEYAKTISVGTDIVFLEQIVMKICSETKGFSASGYGCFGITEEKNKLRIALQ